MQLPYSEELNIGYLSRLFIFIAREAMESEMKKYTLNDLRSGMQELLAKEA